MSSAVSLIVIAKAIDACRCERGVGRVALRWLIRPASIRKAD